MTQQLSASKLSSTQTKKQSINPAFRYLGIPASWLNRQNIRLPSRKTSAFFIGSGSLIALYFYDRHQCKKIKQRYLDQVRHLSETLVSTSNDPSYLNAVAWMPRKVNVYGARIPEDVDVDRGTQWFKRFVKPILIAGAIDYTIHNGTTPGALARKISDDIRDQRLVSAAQLKDRSFHDHQASLKPGMPGYREWHAEQHKLEGGSLILGRTTLKEYMWGLKDGYKRKIPIDELDDDERFSKQLEDVGIFDTPPLSVDEEFSEKTKQNSSSESIPEDISNLHQPFSDQPDLHDQISFASPSGINPPNISDKTTTSRILKLFSKSAPVTHPHSSSSLHQSNSIDETKTLESTLIPPQPPLLLVPFDHPIGIRWWPLKIYRFFNQRYQVELGAETAMKLINSHTRPIEPPKNQGIGILNDDQDLLNGASIECLKINTFEDLKVNDDDCGLTGSEDLDFLAPAADLHLRRSYHKTAKKIIEERANFRNELQNRLKVARREEHDEISVDQNQLNESQLRLEAFQKEKKWHDLLIAWLIVRKGSGISWDPDMVLALKVFDHQHPSNVDSHQSPELE